MQYPPRFLETRGLFSNNQTPNSKQYLIKNIQIFDIEDFHLFVIRRLGFEVYVLQTQKKRRRYALIIT